MTLEYTTARDTRFFIDQEHSHAHTDAHMLHKHDMAMTDSDKRGVPLAF